MKVLTKDSGVDPYGRAQHQLRVAVARSYLDKERWIVELACGHDKWIERKSKPKLGVFDYCPVCEAQEHS